MLWSSVDLKCQSTVCLCLPSGQKPWSPFSSSGQLELMPSQHICPGCSKDLVQVAMLSPDPRPQFSYQLRVQLAPRQPAVTDPLPFLGAKSLDLLCHLHSLKGRVEVSILTKNRAFGAVAIPVLIVNQSSPGEGLNTVCPRCWHIDGKWGTLQVGVTALCQYCPFFSSTSLWSGTRKVDLLIFYQKASD